MSSEDEPKAPAENFIGDMEFGITLEYVQNYLQQIQSELAEEDPAEANSNPRFAQRLRELRNKNEAILSVSADEIFRLLQAIYDLVHESEQRGLEKTDILGKIKTERPELAEAIGNFYGILRSQTWGYRLGQDFLAFKAFRS